MPKAFLDASALFAAAYSRTGAARELIRLAIREEIQIELVTSQFVLEETKRNLRAKAPSSFIHLQAMVRLAGIEILSAPTKKAVLATAQYTALKDAPIVAGALAASAMYLVTFDDRHLIKPTIVAEKSDLIILTPGTLLGLLKRK